MSIRERKFSKVAGVPVDQEDHTQISKRLSELPNYSNERKRQSIEILANDNHNILKMG